MLFSEFRFLPFFVVVFCVAWALRQNAARKTWLLVASYVFYAAWDWRFCFLICASTLIDFIAGAMLGRSLAPARRKAWLVASLAANLGILGFFKYFNFFVESAEGVLHLLGISTGLRTLPIVLPVGISFFTFQSMSYTLDIYRGRLQPTRSFVDFALFVSFFPQLVAGPIVRARGFLPQLVRAPRFRDVAVRRSLLLFLLGFVKKACVADQLSVAVDAVFADPDAYGPASKWIAIGLYSAQIYCDFSGYTDMAIATAGLLGYQLTINFDFPYFSRSIREFWRRWHISLSTWYRDYLYFSLGGNRGSRGRTYGNLTAVFLLCGLWHGAAFTFVAWGLFHGALLVAERGPFGRLVGGLHWTLQTLYVQLAVLVAWVFFRSPDLDAALRYLADMFVPGARPGPTTELAWQWGLLLVGLAAVHWAAYKGWLAGRMERLPDWAFATAYGTLVALALAVVLFGQSALGIQGGHQPFIYFQF